MSATDATQGLDTPPDTRPWLSLAEASQACGVSHSTVRRALDGGRFPQARRDHGPNGPMSGPWRIPVDDLLQAGFKLGRPSPPDDASDSGSGEMAQGHAIGEVERLRTKNAELLRRAEVAEAVAAERGRSLDDLRVALRALPPAPSPAHRPGWRERRRLARAAKALDGSPTSGGSR